MSPRYLSLRWWDGDQVYGSNCGDTPNENKPICEGYKIFLLNTNSGFIVNVPPDRRSARFSNGQEYKQKNELGKVESMVHNLIEVM